jgi:hypothetical protein
VHGRRDQRSLTNIIHTISREWREQITTDNRLETRGQIGRSWHLIAAKGRGSASAIPAAEPSTVP